MKNQLELIRILFKISLLLGLLNDSLIKAEANETQNFKELTNDKELTLNQRMTTIEADNQQHKMEISLLKTRLDDGINTIFKLEAENLKQKTENSVLKTRIDEGSKEIQQLNDRVARLESNCSKTKDNDDILLRKKRPAQLFPSQQFVNEVVENHRSEALNSTSRFEGPPANCSELKMLGYSLNGYYLVKKTNPTNTKRVDIVYCAFSHEMTSKQILQTTIGTVEVKTRSVYFHGHMTENLSKGVIPFKRRDVNIGGALNTWNFTAPVAGTYHFSFYGTVLNPRPDFKMATTLKAGDKVWLYKYGDSSSGTLVGGGKVGYGVYELNSNFFGWLLEED